MNKQGGCGTPPWKIIKVKVGQSTPLYPFKHNIDHDTQNHEYLRKDCYFKEKKGSRYAGKFCYKKAETFTGVLLEGGAGHPPWTPTRKGVGRAPPLLKKKKKKKKKGGERHPPLKIINMIKKK
jgi:hypothetical protein